MRLRTRSFLKVSQQVILDLLPKKRYCCLCESKYVILASQPNVWLRKISMSNDQETIDIMFATKRLDANKYRIHLYIHESTLNFPEK